MAGDFLLILWTAGCGGSTPTTPSKSQASPQTYFTPAVVGDAVASPTAYSFDDTALSFQQTTYSTETQPGPQILEAGNFTLAQRGLRGMGISTSYGLDPSNPNAYIPHNFNPPESGSFAVELAGQIGGLAQLLGQPVEPLVAATECPSSSSHQTYQFVIIPGSLLPPGTAPQPLAGPRPRNLYTEASISVPTAALSISKHQSIQAAFFRRNSNARFLSNRKLRSHILR